MTSPLERIENRIQRLIETSAARLFPGTNLVSYLVHHLVTEMGAHLRPSQDGQLLAPNHFLIGLHPSVAIEVRDNPDFPDQLARLLQLAVEEAGMVFLSDPSVAFYEDHSLLPAQPRISVEMQPRKLEQTKNLAPQKDGQDARLPENAFLIIHGTEIYPLRQTIINIGRRLDNQLVVDDPRVSRLHAQLRVLNDQFVLFDLGSTGGTFVNDQRINQCHLYPGDVISLAGVMLVFGQDAPRPIQEDQDYTRPMSVDDLPGDQTFNSDTTPRPPS